MARPKKDDPTVAVPFRMKRSALGWWEQQADREGVPVSKLIQRVTEEKAERMRKQ